MPTLELFDKPPRRRPRVMMHVLDAGSSGCCDEAGSSIEVACFRCRHCGYESDWIRIRNLSDGKRGHPCPRCNSDRHSLDTRSK